MDQPLCRVWLIVMIEIIPTLKFPGRRAGAAPVPDNIVVAILDANLLGATELST